MTVKEMELQVAASGCTKTDSCCLHN